MAEQDYHRIAKMLNAAGFRRLNLLRILNGYRLTACRSADGVEFTVDAPTKDQAFRWVAAKAGIELDNDKIHA